MNDNTFRMICEHEGRYANDPADSGGETYCGVARNHHADWLGWPIIDEFKAQGADMHSDSVFDAVETLLREFYADYLAENGADRIHGDARSVKALLDHSITSGKGGTLYVCQRVANIWGYPCDVDGLDGPGTRIALKSLNKQLDQDEPTIMFSKDGLPKDVFIARIEHYLKVADAKARGATTEEKAAQLNHLRSWIRRSLECLEEKPNG